jgi:hypothetical protein
MAHPSALSPQQIQQRIPSINQWDVLPAAGTVIGQARIIYGIFMLVVGAVMQYFNPADELFETALYHISRGFESLFSFIPSISEKMIEKDIAAVKAEALKALGPQHEEPQDLLQQMGDLNIGDDSRKKDGAGKNGTAFDTGTGRTGNDVLNPVDDPDY